jgi:hypothetical protein
MADHLQTLRLIKLADRKGREAPVPLGATTRPRAAAQLGHPAELIAQFCGGPVPVEPEFVEAVDEQFDAPISARVLP